MTNVIFRSVMAGAMVLGLAAVATPSATADPPATRHCFIEPAGETTCYATVSEVRDHATSRGMALIPLATFYDNFNFDSPPSITASGPVPCTTTLADIDYEDLRFEEFNNRTSSVDTFNNCDVRLFDFFNPRPNNDNLFTPWIHRDGNLATPGVNWNNRTSAWQLS